MTGSTAAPKESVGDFFRQVRETKGLTLDEVAIKTRIHPEYLKALEESNFAKLPEQVFAKGFVRSYARSLGLDEEDAMRRFTISAGSFYDKHEERERLRQQQVEDERKRKANRKAMIAAAAVAVLGLVLLLTREQGTVSVMRPAEPEAPRAKSSAARAARPDAATAAPAETGAKRATSTAPAQPQAERQGSLPTPATTSDPLAGLPLDGGASAPAPLTLVLEATELSWVVVQVDDASPHEALLRPGERLTWKGQEKFALTVGNAGGIRGELNGKPLAPFGSKGKVVRDIVVTR
jgi:cytoskeletal protein RodZ